MSAFQKVIGAVLNKGGAGISLSRPETAQRLLPIMARHIQLNHAYLQAAERLAGTPLADEIHAALRIARMDVGKLSETVLSMGVTPYHGTDIEPGAAELPVGDDLLKALAEQEQALLNDVDAELALDHQIRTQAILGNVQAHSRDRLKLVERGPQKSRR